MVSEAWACPVKLDVWLPMFWGGVTICGYGFLRFSPTPQFGILDSHPFA